MRIINYLIITIFLFMNSKSLDAKYWWQNSLAEIRSVKILNDSTFIMAGDDGKLIKSIDYGKSWRWIETFDRNDFLAIDFIDEFNGIMTTQNGFVFQSDDAGESWIKSKICDCDLKFAQMITESFFIIADSYGKIQKTSNAGESWEHIDLPEGLELIQIKFFDQETAVALCNNGMIYKTTDGGISWLNITKENPNIILYNFDYVNKDKFIVIGMDTTSQKIRIAIRFEGENSELISGERLGNMPFSKNIKVFDEENIVLLGVWGSVCRTDSEFDHLENDTIFCEKFLKRETSQTSMFEHMDADKKGIVLIAGKENTIAISVDSGKTINLLRWARIAIPIYQRNVTFYCIDAHGDKVFAGSEGEILKSDDGGTTWYYDYPRGTINNEGFLNTKYLSSHFRNEDFGFIAGYWSIVTSQKEPVTAYTSDGGNFWQTKNEVSINKLSFYDKNNGFGIIDSMIHKTTDAGLTWESWRLTGKNDYEENIIDISAINESVGYLITKETVKTDTNVNYPYGIKSEVKIYKTDNGFQDIKLINRFDALEAYLTRCGFYGENSVYFYGSADKILKTTDGGDTWIDINMNTFHYFNDIEFVSRDNWIACGNKDTVFYTSDAGESWEVEVPDFKILLDKLRYFNDIYLADNGDIFLAGAGRLVKGVWYDDNTEIIEEPENGYKYNPYFYIRISPNPVDGHALFKLYGLYSVNNEFISFRIFNIFGEEVMDLSEMANQNNDGSVSVFESDLSMLPQGVYFSVMTSSGYALTKKLIITK